MNQEGKTPRANGHSDAAKGDHMAPAERREQDSKRSQLKNWRIPIFLLAAVALTIVGFKCKALATPGRESASLLLSPPLLVFPLASSPNVAVHLTMIMNASHSCSNAGAATNCQNSSEGTLYATVTESGSSADVNRGGKILIVSTKPGYLYSDTSISQYGPQSTKTTAYANVRSKRFGYFYLLTIGIRTIEQGQGLSQYGVPIAEFDLPSVTQNTNGSFFAHLPEIGLSPTQEDVTSISSNVCISGMTVGSSSASKTSDSSSNCSYTGSSSSTTETTGLSPSLKSVLSVIPLALTETGRLRGTNVSDIILGPDPKEEVLKLLANADLANTSNTSNTSNKKLAELLRNTANYPTIPGSQDDLYWWTTTQVTEVLSGAQSSLANARIDSIVPPDGTLEGDSYVWEGASSLEPSISATNIDATESQSNYAFLAGIFFATSAAAAIAFVQELPEVIPLPGWWPRWRRRKRNHARPTGRIDSGLGWPE